MKLISQYWKGIAIVALLLLIAVGAFYIVSLRKEVANLKISAKQVEAAQNKAELDTNGKIAEAKVAEIVKSSETRTQTANSIIKTAENEKHNPIPRARNTSGDSIYRRLTGHDPK